MSIAQTDVNESLKRIGGAWGWLLAFGIITIAAGVCMFFFTAQALYVIAVLFGIFLVVAGVFHFVGAFTMPGESAWLRALFALLSAFAVVAGVYLIKHPVLTLLTITLLVGFFWIFSGMLELMAGIAAPSRPHRGWVIVGGGISIIAGFLLVFWPQISTLVLALLLGVWLVLYGLIMVVGAFSVRSATKEVRAQLSPRHA